MSGILQTLIYGVSVVKDAYFNLVTLLLNTTATNGAQNNTFLDSSSNNFTITRNGNTTQGTFTPFSQTGWGNYFNGSSDYLTLPQISAYNIGTGAFTCEAWVYATAGISGGATAILNLGNGAVGGGPFTGWGLLLNYASASTFNLAWYRYDGTTETNLYTSTTLNLNQWNHILAVRSGTNLSLYINGVRGYSSSSNSVSYSNINSDPIYMARRVDGASGSPHYFNGYISNARLVVGTAVYDPTQTSITVPTSPLTAITNTQILVSQNNRFVDNSSNAATFTINGTPSVQAFSPFAPTTAYSTSLVGGSGYFDGSGDSLSIAYNAALMVGAGDFTWEAWLYPTATGGNHFIFSQSGPSLDIYRNGSNKLVIDQAGVANLATSTNTIPLNAWTHYAFTRSGTTTRLFVNGVIDVSGTSAAVLTNLNATSIGSGWPGYITDHRLVKGTAVYTSNFTPPTAPLTAITNTSLLLSATNAGIYDSAAKNDLETVGNAQVSTTQAKWGTT